MKKLFPLILILVTTILYSKTDDFSVISKKQFNSALFDITEDYDRTITAVGFAKEFKKDSTSSRVYTNAFDYLASQSGKYGSQMHIIKVDNKAKVLLSKSAHLHRFNEAVAVVKTPSNGYFIGGYTLDGSLIVAKLDSNANILYAKIFGTKNYDRMSNLVSLSDGGVLAVGFSITSRDTRDNMFETGLGNNDIYLTRFSKDGRILWSKKYGTKHDDRGIDAVEAIDGSILVITTTSYEKNRDVTIMRITENGNKIWLKQYKDEKNPDDLIVPRKIIRLRDNNFVIALSQYNSMQKEHVRFIKFDLYQNILIDKEIFTTYPSSISDIKEFSNGKLMAVGYVKDSFNTDGLVFVLDSNLVLLNQEHYGDDNYDAFKSLVILHNSQVGVAGMHTDNFSQESKMWILKLNQDGSIAQVSTNIGKFYDRLCSIFKDEIKKHKIVIKEDLSIEFVDNNLYFKTAKYKLTPKQKEFLDSFRKKLIPFLYKNREYIETLEVSGHTSSEWGVSDFSSSYLNNSKLSLNRSYSVLSYIFKNESKDIQKWLSKVVKGSGYSYSKNIEFNDIEDRTKSRRVSFKILLKHD